MISSPPNSTEPAEPPRWLSRLSSRLVLGVVAFACVMGGAYYGLVHGPLRERYGDLDEAELQIVMHNLQEQLSSDYVDARAELESIARLGDVISFDKEKADDAILQAQTTSLFFKKFTLLDGAGRIVSRPSMRSTEGDDRSSRAYFSEPLKLGRFFTDDVKKVAGGLSLSMGVPVRGANGEARGVLAGHIELTGAAPRLCKLTRDWPIPSNYEATVLSRDGVTIARSAGPLRAERFEELIRRDHPLFARATSEGIADVFRIDDVEYYGVARTLEPADWVVILQVDRAPIVESVSAAVNRIGWLLGLVFLGLLGGVLFYGSRILRPIGLLTSSLVAFGKEGAARPLRPVRGVGELANAIEAFNQMVVDRSQAESEFQRGRARYQALAAELSKVEQRTRHAIAAELHDQMSQDLAAAKIRLELLVGRQLDVGREESLEAVIGMLDRSIVHVSSLSKRLAQPSEQRLGIGQAVEDLVASYDAQFPIEFRFQSDGVEGAVSDEVADILYRGVTELLHNVVKHAEATRASVRLSVRGDMLRIEIEDDGVGFHAPPKPPDAGEIGGFGLFSVRERLRSVGGTLEVHSRPNRGCHVTVAAPIVRTRSEAANPRSPVQSSSKSDTEPTTQS